MLFAMIKESFSLHTSYPIRGNDQATADLLPRAILLACNRTETEILNIALGTLRELATVGAESSDPQRRTRETDFELFQLEERTFRTHFPRGEILESVVKAGVSRKFRLMLRAADFDGHWQLSVHCVDVEDLCRPRTAARISGEGRQIVLVSSCLIRPPYGEEFIH